MKTKGFIITFLMSVVVAVIAVYAYSRFVKPEVKVITADSQQKMVYANLPQGQVNQVPDFTYAAEKAVHAVVHVKTKSMKSYGYNPFYEFFFGERQYMQPQPQMGFGSGVIISSDGYIITNNHVIDESDEIEVVLNDKRSFIASVVGTDKSTDLALLKIEAKDLPIIPYGNSDDLKLGQWVLAIGNPYNLTSTVTAGIVSAKARNINILNDRSAIEAFIQTDAAVNPGNSGGALVNTNGELVGINTAIASQTGSYVGNSFAIPVSIVKKVIADLKEYGAFQRAVMGVEIMDVTQELAREKKIDKLEGVYIANLSENSAAEDAGIKEGDIILSVNNVPVNSSAELQEQISKYRPNDKINVLIRRDNKDKVYNVTLRNLSGTTGIVKKGDIISTVGASFEPITSEDKEELGIRSGVRVVSVSAGKFKEAGVKPGFIITHMNNKSVTSVDEIKDFLSRVKGGVYLEGVYPNGTRAYYAFGM